MATTTLPPTASPKAKAAHNADRLGNHKSQPNGSTPTNGATQMKFARHPAPPMIDGNAAALVEQAIDVAFESLKAAALITNRISPPTMAVVFHANGDHHWRTVTIPSLIPLLIGANGQRPRKLTGAEESVYKAVLAAGKPTKLTATAKRMGRDPKSGGFRKLFTNLVEKGVLEFDTDNETYWPTLPAGPIRA